MDGTLVAPPQPTTSTHQEKFRRLLEELFMFDQADLDFGIYRIMNAKRDEITRFLNDDLLPQARAALGTIESGERAQIKTELDRAVEAARTAGFDPDQSPRVKELRARYGAEPDQSALEAEVFSHLYQFFRRYYSEGDFISQRRYKAGVYAIPYEGEEVKLHWANHDQYYIKSGENFRDYAFKLPDGRRVHFKLADANTERNNNKAAEGQERRFMLMEEEPILEQDGELVIRFAYQPEPGKRKQGALNDEAVRRIHAELPASWRLAVEAKAPTEKDPNRLLLARHLADYTARNTFDYFIHKDLGGFLRRELDFYIKNEVVHLDDIESESAPRVEQYLGKVRAIRRIAHQIIDFLAQLEDFQKQLWLKKKFVVETNYCITLDRVPEELYAEIAANDAQREEWVRLFAIDEIKTDLTRPGYSVPLTVKFLKVNPFLVLDTRLYDDRFKDRLLASIEDVVEQMDGLLVHSENFQALVLLHERYREQIQCIYIDPPYNTSENSFVYKNNYKHSSWASMIQNRVAVAKQFSSPGGILGIAIDDTEEPRLRMLLDSIYGEQSHVSTIAAEVNPAGQNIRPNVPARSHDYFIVYAHNADCVDLLTRSLTPAEKAHYSERDEKGQYIWDNLRRRGGNSRPTDRPKQWFPLYIDPSTRSVSVDPLPGAEEAWPIDPKGIKRIWRYNPAGVRRELAAGEIGVLEKAGRLEIVKKSRMPEGKKPKTLWKDSSHSATTYGTKLLNDIVRSGGFTYPKSLHLVQDCLAYWLKPGGETLDFFAGSGTTGHAVINLNREDGGSRKYILVEMGEYFDTVLKPRIQKVIYSKDWKDGKPISREGSSHMFKYVRLESYEDTLNNLELRRTSTQQELLDTEDDFRRDYLLHYMLDVESRGSASLLDLERFEDPFSYSLKIGTGSAGETRPVKVDLVETFNYLLGLRVKHIDRIRGIRVVQGSSPEGERVLVIWRNTREVSSPDLDTFFQKQGYNTRDAEFDVIYVNGDNNLENLRRADETWKVRLIEEEFMSRMFDVHDV
jgi:adenine-specific DNA-methyltransferase